MARGLWHCLCRNCSRRDTFGHFHECARRGRLRVHFASTSENASTIPAGFRLFCPFSRHLLRRRDHLGACGFPCIPWVHGHQAGVPGGVPGQLCRRSAVVLHGPSPWAQDPGTQTALGSHGCPGAGPHPPSPRHLGAELPLRLWPAHGHAGGHWPVGLPAAPLPAAQWYWRGRLGNCLGRGRVPLRCHPRRPAGQREALRAMGARWPAGSGCLVVVAPALPRFARGAQGGRPGPGPRG